MHKSMSSSQRACICFALILAAAGLALFFSAQPISAAPLPKETSNYAVHFLPNAFRRLCVGDSHHYAFMVKFIEPEAYEPVEIGENGLPVPVPLQVYKARVTATHGTVQPSEFVILSPNEVFRFEYTATSAGQENIQVTLEDGASGQAAKTLEIVGSCNYDLKFFAKERKTVEASGFEAVFKGRGDFSLNRTDQDANAVTGSGRNEVSLGIWAAAPELFLCQMTPIRSSGTFDIEGTLQLDYDYLQVSLYFKPMTLPGNMRFDCQALGFDSLAFDFPIDQTTVDGNDLDMVGLTFPVSGGVDTINLGQATVTVWVKLKD